MVICSHNPLVPGSSPGGPTRNEKVRTGHMVYVWYRPHGLHTILSKGFPIV